MHSYGAWVVLGLAAGVCTCASDARAQGSVAGDRAALEAFYSATGGSNWEE